MLNMKSKVTVLLTNKIKRMKVIGRQGQKGHGYKVGSIVMTSVKEGEHATPMSQKGTKHYAIVAATRYRHNSLLVNGITDIQYNKNLVLLCDIKTKKAPLINPSTLSIPVHSEVKVKLEQLAKLAKRKDQFNFMMV